MCRAKHCGFLLTHFCVWLLHQQIVRFNLVGVVLKLKYRQFCSNQSRRMYENACDRIEKKLIDFELILDFFIFLF